MWQMFFLGFVEGLWWSFLYFCRGVFLGFGGMLRVVAATRLLGG